MDPSFAPTKLRATKKIRGVFHSNLSISKGLLGCFFPKKLVSTYQNAKRKTLKSTKKRHRFSDKRSLGSMNTSVLAHPSKPKAPLSKAKVVVRDNRNTCLGDVSSPKINGKSPTKKGCVLSSWWFQPTRKICSSNWIISPGRGENKTYLKPPPDYRWGMITQSKHLSEIDHNSSTLICS